MKKLYHHASSNEVPSTLLYKYLCQKKNHILLIQVKKYFMRKQLKEKSMRDMLTTKQNVKI